MDVSIIIVNYNNADLTLECIESIYKEVKSIQFEIIVVDNASRNKELDLIINNFPEVIGIQSDENLGFGRANNLGAQHAVGEYLFLLNSDTILLNDPFVYFFEFVRNNICLEFGALGAFMTDEFGIDTLSGGSLYSSKKYLCSALNSYFGLSRKKEIDVLCENYCRVGYVIGADMFLKRKTFDEIAGFDECIFMYFEDVEMCNRLEKKGYASFLLKGPKILHLVGKRKVSQFCRLHNMASLMYCMHKDNSSFSFFMFQLAMFLLKFPILFTSRFTFCENWTYLSSIFAYKKYLVQQ